MKHLPVLIFSIFTFFGILSAKEEPSFQNHAADPWVDSIMMKLTLEQKIGQLFMIQAYSNKKNEQTEELIEIISKYQVGGIIFMQGGPVTQAKISNQLQEASIIPLLVAIDAENGLGYRLDSTISFPSQMALGAITSDSLIYRTLPTTSAAWARTCTRRRRRESDDGS